MFSSLSALSAPLASILLIMLGVGLYGTLVPLSLRNIGAPEWVIGLTGSALYAGMVAGTFTMAHFIKRVGHIRAYTACAGTIAGIILCTGLYISPLTWIPLRALVGFCMGGVYIVIESWFLDAAPLHRRGVFLALYMIALYASQAAGQLLIKLFPINSLNQFCMASMLTCFSIVPLTITRIVSPDVHEPEALTLKKLYTISASGVVGCFGAGAINSAIFSIMPLYFGDSGYSEHALANAMASIIGGAMVLQYPVSYVSDLMDKRKVMYLLSLMMCLICTIILALPVRMEVQLPILFMLLGGATFTLYPVSINHTCAQMDRKHLVEATQGLLLAYGIGCIIGPVAASGLMGVLGRNGLLLYYICTSAAMAFFFIHRSFHDKSKGSPQVSEVALSLPTSPVTAEVAVTSLQEHDTQPDSTTD
ncbi:MAG: MFS transporter [Alphaproteobacteria bacterium]|nr:MAG: MFS transporter [Alphaproteobacteria bacterium]